ncbi:hypothetical protein NBM05_06490 [Rothia sp. AR01]|uniref:Uncharacterized protein n=1 Tax=Rothia santali TaxID=2949643 RepID=A0A9X2HJY7_9MICC|nr:hypothetical protein [Rothia santali]MCP3425668.1 hypothetical protein [Rothia santali]
MEPGAFIASASALGVGGLDPAPPLIAAVYMAARPAADPLAAGRVRRAVLVFGVLLIGGTALWGVLLSRLVGDRLDAIPWGHLLRAGAVVAWIELAVALAGLVYAGYRWRIRNRPPKEEKNRSFAGLLLVAAGFVALVTSDPPFVLAAGLSGNQPLWAAATGLVLWALISQAPLAVLCGAVVANQHRRVAVLIGRWWSAAERWVNIVLPAGIAAVCALMLVDVGKYFLLGRFLIDPSGVL